MSVASRKKGKALITAMIMDRENIRQILSEPDGEIGRVGLRNVHQRLRLIYGPAGVITIGETPAGTILATVRFPVE